MESLKKTFGNLRQLAKNASWYELTNTAEECVKFFADFKDSGIGVKKDKYEKFLERYEDAVLITVALDFQNKKTQATNLRTELDKYLDEYFHWLGYKKEDDFII